MSNIVGKDYWNCYCDGRLLEHNGPRLRFQGDKTEMEGRGDNDTDEVVEAVEVMEDKAETEGRGDNDTDEVVEVMEEINF